MTLHERRPAVIALTGPPGMGKSSLLLELRARAVAHGWHVVGGTPELSIVVNASTREEDLSRRILESLPQPENGNGFEPAEVASWLQSPSDASDSLVDDLVRRAEHDSLLLLVDDYRPSPALGRWFEETFVAGILRSGAPIVVVVAQRSEACGLSDVPVVALGPLDRQLVRRVLGELSEQLDPPLTKKELRIYAGEARTPLLLDSLVRVLSLARRTEVAP